MEGKFCIACIIVVGIVCTAYAIFPPDRYKKAETYFAGCDAGANAVFEQCQGSANGDFCMGLARASLSSCANFGKAKGIALPGNINGVQNGEEKTEQGSDPQ